MGDCPSGSPHLHSPSPDGTLAASSHLPLPVCPFLQRCPRPWPWPFPLPPTPRPGPGPFPMPLLGRLQSYEGWVDAPLLLEIFYSIILCNYVLDYSVEDLRLHHLGWTTTDYYRQYTSYGGVTVVLPPGRMLQLIDVGSYRTRHFNFTLAKGIMTTAFYFTMFGKRDRIKQLDDTAKTLFKWYCCVSPRGPAGTPWPKAMCAAPVLGFAHWRCPIPCPSAPCYHAIAVLLRTLGRGDGKKN